MKSDLNFLYEIGAFRYKKRAWMRFFTPDFATITEHTYRVIWIALIIAAHEKIVDTGKLVKLAIVHDLGESRGVDVDYVSREFTTRDEEAAMNATLKGTILEKEFKELWIEVEERKSIEAKIIKDADNLDVDLELMEQEFRGSNIRKAKQETRENVYKTKFFTETAKKMWEQIQDSDPSEWFAGDAVRNMKNRKL